MTPDLRRVPAWITTRPWSVVFAKIIDGDGAAVAAHTTHDGVFHFKFKMKLP